MILFFTKGCNALESETFDHPGMKNNPSMPFVPYKQHLSPKRTSHKGGSYKGVVYGLQDALPCNDDQHRCHRRNREALGHFNQL